jgi:hypothetical protein
MPDFSYTKVNGISPIPIVTTYFSNLSNPSMITTCNCGILDTGSDLTIVSYSVISKIQATAIDRQQSISFRGLGRSSQGIAYRVGMSFESLLFLMMFSMMKSLLEEIFLIVTKLLLMVQT